MKRMLLGLGMLLGLCVVSYAATPQETYFTGQEPLYNTTIIGSTSTIQGGTSATVTVPAPVAFSSGGSSTAGRNCFTKILAQLDSGATMYILDGPTTDYYVIGQDLGAAPGNTISLNEETKGPLCFTAGNSTTFNLTTTKNNNVVDFEGYTSYGVGSSANKGN